MQFTCAPALAAPTAPVTPVPAGACDSHFHIFGPYRRFPLADMRPYTPPPALMPQYRQMAGILGLTRHVVVQASVSGTDNAVTMDAVVALGRDVARAVVVVDGGSDLAALAAAGAVGVRFNLVSGNGPALAALEALSGRVAALGWHIQVYVRGAQLSELAPRLAALPVPVVLDHMGGLDAANPQGLDSLLRLLESDRVWLKLSGTRAGAPGPALTRLAVTLAAAAPGRCIWGSDWPHTQMAPMPDDGLWLDHLAEWVPDVAARHRILVENPAALYRFPP